MARFSLLATGLLPFLVCSLSATGPILASGTPSLVRDIATWPARLPFDGDSWQLPRADVVESRGVVWTVSAQGMVAPFLHGGLVAQLRSGEAVGLRSGEDGWHELFRTDGSSVVTLADSIRLLGTRPYVAELGAGVVFNGAILDPEDGTQRFGHWYADGNGPPQRVGNYGSIEPAPPFGPIHCGGPVATNGAVLFCANEEGSHSSGALWSISEGSAAVRLTAPGSQTLGMLADPSGSIVHGLTQLGPFRSDGTVPGTEVLPFPPGELDPISFQPVGLAGGVGWFGYSETAYGFWWLPPGGGVVRLLDLVGPGSHYLVGSSRDHVYFQSYRSLPFGASARTISSLGATGNLTELGPIGGVGLFAPVGGSGEAVLDLLDEDYTPRLLGSDGENLVTLLEGSRDREGIRTGPTPRAGQRDDGVLVGFRNARGQTLPWLVRPGLTIERWRDLRLGGTASSSPGPLRHGGDRLVFLAPTARGGTGLWQSQGTAGSTRALMRNPMEGCRTIPWRTLVLASDRLALGCIDADGAVPIYELPASDDRRGLVRELGRVPGPQPTSELDLGLAAVEVGRRVVVARGGISAFDRLSATTEALGPGSGPSVLGERALFLREGGDETPEIWSTDGTPAGTTRLLQGDGAWTTESSLVRLGTRLVVASSTRLYSSDGTADGTRDIGEAMTLLPAPAGASLGCGIAVDPLWGQALWGFDPVTGGRTYLDSFAAWTLVATSEAGVDDTEVWFLARTGSGELGLWRCDGTQAGSGLVVADLPSFLVRIAPSPAGIFLLGFSPEAQELLRVSRDGSEVEVLLTMPRTINDEAFSSDLTVVGPHVFFTAADDAHGRELWALRWDEAWPELE